MDGHAEAGRPAGDGEVHLLLPQEEAPPVRLPGVPDPGAGVPGGEDGDLQADDDACAAVFSSVDDGPDQQRHPHAPQAGVVCVDVLRGAAGGVGEADGLLDRGGRHGRQQTQHRDAAAGVGVGVGVGAEQARLGVVDEAERRDEEIAVRQPIPYVLPSRDYGC